MRIPEVRERIRELAQMMRHHGFVDWARELEYLAEEMKRRPYIHKVREPGNGRDEKLSPAMVRYARRLRKQGMSYKEISRVLGVYNHGRISEACRGKRT